jgi:basic membrane protein A
MKKIALFLAAFILFASFVSADNSNAPDKKQLKVALIFDMGGRGDNGFNDSAYLGFEKARRDFNIVAMYLEPKRSLDRDSMLAALAASDADMIIGIGFAFTDSMNALAARYPAKKFVCVDYSVAADDSGRVIPPPSNLAALLFREEEGSFLVGAIAALKSGTGKIGFVGGMESPLIRKFEAGYIAGAMAAKPETVVISRFAGVTGKAFNNPDKGFEIASKQYENGADIIFHAAGVTGAGVFRAAEKFNRYAIGVDIDQRLQAPGHVLTSMTKNVDVAVYQSVRALVEGRFSGGIKTLGLKENGVGFVYNERNKDLIGDDIYEQAQELKEQIVKGEIAVPVSVNARQIFTEQDIREFLTQFHTDIKEAMNDLEKNLEEAARELSGKPLEGSAAREALKKLYASHPYIIDCETVNSRGIMLAVEPKQHRAAEGADISKQAHMVKLFRTKEPVLSGAFLSVEGPEAVAFHYPVFSVDRKFSGSVSALFAPHHLLAGIIGPVASNLPFNIALQQTDGTRIYDLNPRHAVRNTMADPLYKPIPESAAMNKKVATEKEGFGSYRFYPKGSNKPVTRLVYWKTADIHGTEWRIVINCPAENIAK